MATAAFRAPRVARVAAVGVVLAVALIACMAGAVEAAAQNPPPAGPALPAPCTGPGCISTPPPEQNGPPPSSCSLLDIGGCVSSAIDTFLRNTVVAALNPLLDLLANSLLTTPRLDEVPVLGQIWRNSQHIMITAYALVVMIAGIVIATYQTMQTRQSAKEALPRVVVGFLAANLSLFFGGMLIDIANALSQALLGDGLDPHMVAASLRESMFSAVNLSTMGGVVGFIALALAVMLIAILLTYVVRVMLTVVLLAGAPILLMCHALPQTERIAIWWWKAIAGVMVVQVVQAFTLISALRLFFWPGGIPLFQ